MIDLRKLLFSASMALACLAMPLTMQATDPSSEQDYIDLLATSLTNITGSSSAINPSVIATTATDIATSIATIIGFELTPDEESHGPPPSLGSALEKVYDLFFVDKTNIDENDRKTPVLIPTAGIAFLPLTKLTPTSGSSNLIANCTALRKALAIEPITVILDPLNDGEEPIVHGPFTLLHTVIHQGSAMMQMGGMKSFRAKTPNQGPGPVQQFFMRPEQFDPMLKIQVDKLKAFFNVAPTTPSTALTINTDATDASALLSAKDGFDNTILHYATVFTNSKNINTSIIDPLFKKITSAQKLTLLTAQNLWGNTPLHYAAGISNPFSRGDAGLSRPSKEGLTYRLTKDIIADVKGDRTAAAATITAKNLAGLTPLHAATASKDTIGNLSQLISLLPAPAAGVDSVADILSKATDFFGNTPLHYFLLRAFSSSDESMIEQAHNRPPDDNFSHGFPPPGSGYTMEAWNDDTHFMTDEQKTAYAAKTDDEKVTYTTETIANDLTAARNAITKKINGRNMMAAALAVFLGNIKLTEKLAALLNQKNTFGLTPLQLMKCGNPDIDLTDNITDGTPVDLDTELHTALALQEVSLAYLPVHFHPFIGVERVGEGQGGNQGGNQGGGQQNQSA